MIARANEMIDQLEREGRFELTGEYAVTLSELEAVIPLLEEAATIPGFEDAHVATPPGILLLTILAVEYGA